MWKLKRLRNDNIFWLSSTQYNGRIKFYRCWKSPSMSECKLTFVVLVCQSLLWGKKKTFWTEDLHFRHILQRVSLLRLRQTLPFHFFIQYSRNIVLKAKNIITPTTAPTIASLDSGTGDDAVVKYGANEVFKIYRFHTINHMYAWTLSIW